MKLLLTLLLNVLFCQLTLCQEKFDTWESAKRRAAETNKNVLIVLTGTEWCAPCIKTKRRVFENREFASFAEERLGIFELSLPKGKNGVSVNSKIHADYAVYKKRYNAPYLPSLILVNTEGIELAKISDGNTSLKKVLTVLRGVK